MYYLFFQIWVWLLIAFALGWVAHWFICCRGRSEEPSHGTANLAITESANADIPEVADDWKPQGLAEAPANKDDLKRIKGIGSVIENTLNDLGIYHFQQIARWSHENVAWVDHFLSFPGRIARENWVSQAKTLDEGGTTEFAQRVDKGDIDYT